MKNSEFNNIEEPQNTDGLDAGQIGAGVGILGLVFGIGMGIKAWNDRRALKKEREKNKLYQEAIRKHQAKINELKSEKERRAYRDRLWELLQAEMEE